MLERNQADIEGFLPDCGNAKGTQKSLVTRYTGSDYENDIQVDDESHIIHILQPGIPSVVSNKTCPDTLPGISGIQPGTPYCKLTTSRH